MGCSLWDSPGKNNGMGCHSLLQGIFPTQQLNPGLPNCRQILYHLSHQESPLNKCQLTRKLLWPHANSQPALTVSAMWPASPHWTKSRGRHLTTFWVFPFHLLRMLTPCTLFQSRVEPILQSRMFNQNCFPYRQPSSGSTRNSPKNSHRSLSALESTRDKSLGLPILVKPFRKSCMMICKSRMLKLFSDVEGILRSEYVIV